MTKKIRIIAHGANSLENIEKAFSRGADFVEVDVSKQVFTTRFVAQHQGILGKIGIGKKLEQILSKIPQEKIIFDIKHPQFTPSFAGKFHQLLEKFNFKRANIVSDNWSVLLKLANKGDYRIYFLVESQQNLEQLIAIREELKNKNFGVIIGGKFLNYAKLAPLMRNGIQIFAGIVNDIDLFKRSQELGVEGVITDEVAKLRNFLKNS